METPIMEGHGELDFPGHEPQPLGTIWIDCPYPPLSAELKRVLRAHTVPLHQGPKPPEGGAPSAVICHTDSEVDVASEVRRFEVMAPSAPVLIFGLCADLALARAAMRAGARGFLHAEMPPEQIIRALSLAEQGEVVLPRELLNDIVAEECKPDLSVLSPRQLEILELVAEGLSNKQIAKRLWLSMSTIKQHLGGAYKFMGVHNRNQAAVVFRRNKPVEQAGRGDGVKR
jgi:DNA-binding NarL/FixJ family response regulator